MGIIEKLSGGKRFFEQKENTEPTNSVYMKFDDDEDILLYENLNVNQGVTFVLSKESMELEFICPKTGKKFKLYRK